MTVEVSSASQAILERRVASGRSASANEAVDEALRQMEVRESMPGRDLVEAFAASPHKEIELIHPWPEMGPWREIEL